MPFKSAIAPVTITVTISVFLKTPCFAGILNPISGLHSLAAPLHVLRALCGRTDATKHSRGVTCS
jgi:hypothetical protein